MNKPLPTPREQFTQKRSKRSSKSPRSSPMSSPIPIISVDDSACYPDYDCSPKSLSTPVSSRRASFHPSFFPSKLLPRRMHATVPPATKPTLSRPPRPPASPPTPQQIRASVMRFLEQQEREMQMEVQRVGSEIRDLKRCVRAVKREQTQIQARSQYLSERGRSVRLPPGGEYEPGSGSDADTEEVNVVVISAD